MRNFRFAIQSFSAPSAKDWRERARKVEDLGYTTLHLADHFLGPGEAIASTNHPIQELAAVPAMAVAAEATSSLRVGCRVFCVDYHHPAVLAKEAATLDFLSEGRLELGLGAGWLEAEYHAAGIPFDRPGARIARLAEVVALVKAHMSGAPIDLAGLNVNVKGYAGAPAPVQKPHPPIMIGGGGRRVLELAGREADIVSLNFNNRAGIIGPDGVQTSTAAATAEKVGWVRAAAGARMDEIELEIGAYFTIVTDKAEDTAKAFGAGMGLEASDMLAHPHALIGTTEAIADELVRRRETYGISYVTVPDNAIDAFAPVVKQLSGS